MVKQIHHPRSRRHGDTLEDEALPQGGHARGQWLPLRLPLQPDRGRGQGQVRVHHPRRRQEQTEQGQVHLHPVQNKT